MWKKYFKLVKLSPGVVVVKGKGKIDFSNENLSVDLCKELFENDFPYLQITNEGKKELYGLNAENAMATQVKKPRKRKK